MNTPHRGRPKKKNTRRAISLYLRDDEKAAIDQVRGQEERSTWIRQAIQERLEKETKK